MKKIIIILSFLCLEFIKLIHFISEGPTRKIIFYLVVFAAYSACALLSFKKHIIGRAATYILIVSILLTGTVGLLIGIVRAHEQPIFRAGYVLIGLYFAIGGISLAIVEKAERRRQKSQSPI